MFFRPWIRRRLKSQFLAHRTVFLERVGRDVPPEGLTFRSVVAEGESRFLQADAGENSDLPSLVAVQPVCVEFDAVRGGDMESAPGLHSVRSAVALFSYRDTGWDCGRLLYNLSADQAVELVRATWIDSPAPPVSAT